MPDTSPTRPIAVAATTARLSLGRSGSVLPTRDHLSFQLDHALARDAVHAALDVPMLEQGLRARGYDSFVDSLAAPLIVRSAAHDRAEYLRRPDLGRRLDPTSADMLRQRTQLPGYIPPQLVVILADGLSALAAERHALPLLAALAPLIPDPCALTPVVLATQARVALGDAIGDALGARLTVMLLGERPGLSSPDSLGAYLTWNPRPGRVDAERNCISNIRAEGLSYAEAAARIAHYLHEAERLQTTGIALKDPGSQPSLSPSASIRV